MFKDELRKLRINNDLTQEDLAKKLDVSKSTISMYESGSRVPGLEMLEAIADFFNIDMNRLTSNANSTNSNFTNYSTVFLSPREKIAKVLKRLREKKGLTADEVGNIIGKSGKTVNAWENNRGQPDAEILMQLCDIYDVSNILAEFREDDFESEISLSNHEKKVIIAYRDNTDMQQAVDRLLFVVRDDAHLIYRAAKSKNNAEHKIESRTNEEMKRLADAPTVKKDEDL